MVCGELIHSLWCVKSSFTHLVCGELNLVCADLKHGCASLFFPTAQAHPSGVVPVVANLETYVKQKKNKKNEFQGEIWEKWALTYGRNGSSERKNTYVTDLNPSERFVRGVSHLEPKDKPKDT